MPRECEMDDSVGATVRGNRHSRSSPYDIHITSECQHHEPNSLQATVEVTPVSPSNRSCVQSHGSCVGHDRRAIRLEIAGEPFVVLPRGTHIDDSIPARPSGDTHRLSSPMVLLRKSFMEPVSDMEAIENSFIETLGPNHSSLQTRGGASYPRCSSHLAPACMTLDGASNAGIDVPYVYREQIRVSTKPVTPSSSKTVCPDHHSPSMECSDAYGVTVMSLSGNSPTAMHAEECVAPRGPLNSSPECDCAYLTTGAFYAPPILAEDIEREQVIVDHFNELSTETRRLELLEAFSSASRAPYEYDGRFSSYNWDDVTLTPASRWFGMQFDMNRYCFYFILFRRQFRCFVFSFLLRCLCLFLLWVIMFCMLPANWFHPGGLYFDTGATIAFAGVVGTVVARLVSLPSIVGIIWAGILWNNIPYTSYLTSGITMDMRQFVSVVGLTIGLLRAGLSLNTIRFKQKFKHYIAFSVFPMIAEATAHGLTCKKIYGYPNYHWAMTEGFLLSSIAPSVLVPIIVAYQKKGYAARDGPSMMMLCSIAIDTACCVWAVQFLVALEFQTTSLTVLIVMAIVQVILGVVGGCLLGILVFLVVFYVIFMEGEGQPNIRGYRNLSVQHSVHVRYISLCLLLLVCLAIQSVGWRFSCLGGSAIGTVMTAGTFNYLCVRGGTRDHLKVKAEMAQSLATAWDYLIMPALFGLTGSSVDVHQLFARDFIGQASALVFVGVATRCVVAILCPFITGLGLSWRELIFCGFGWIGKGSVQSALGSTFLIHAQRELAAASTAEAIAVAQRRVEDATRMKNTAVLGILIACPICSVFLNTFTSKLLTPGT